MAKVTIRKEWATEEDVEVPDGLDSREMKKWLTENYDVVENAAPLLASDVDTVEWSATYAVSENGDEITDW